MNDDDKKRPDSSGAGPSPPDRASNEPGSVTVEMLSRYLEDPNDLSSSERDLVERELAQNPDVEQTFRQLDVLTAELGNLPRVEPPRSYRVTPEMIGAEAPTRIDQHELWYMRHMDKIRWTAAAAAILFVAVVTADLMVNGLGPGGSGDDDDSDAQVMMSAQDDEAARSEDESAGAAADGDAAAEQESLEEADDDDAAASDLDESEESGASDDSAGAGDPADMPEEEADQDEGAGISGEPGTMPTPAGTPAAEEELEEQEDSSPETDGSDTEQDAAPYSSDEFSTPSQGELESAQFEGDSETTSAAEPDNDRTLWRAAEFSLIIIVAILLALVIFLPRRRGRDP